MRRASARYRAQTSLALALLLALALAAPANAAATSGDFPGTVMPSSPDATTDPPPDETPSGTVRLMAVGDVMLGQSIGRRIVKKGPLAPWAKVKQYFDQADLVVANLECAISDRGTAWPKTFTFRAPLAAADSLAAAGIDLVTVANNHALDYGRDAFGDTLTHLDDHAIAHVGGGSDLDAARAPVFLEQNGLRIAFLGYVLPFSGRPAFSTRQWAASATRAGLALGSPEVVAHDVALARLSADVVIVMVHGGIEYTARPNKAQRNFDRAAINAGAALVIGAHPHVLQGYVLENRTLIAYSTGNFVFDYFVGAPNDTAILDVTLSANGVESLDWIPVVIQNGFPRPAVGAEIGRIMRLLRPLPSP